MACVSVPCLLIQLLLRNHPSWKAYPAAVISEDKPLGLILEVNRAAKTVGIHPGMRYASALSLAPSLRAGVVLPDKIEAGRQLLLKTLQLFSPEVEPWELDPGIFWLNADGLQHIFSSLHNWIRQLKANLDTLGFAIKTAVGFTRFGTLAAAKMQKASIIFHSRAEEQEHSMQAPLSILPLKQKSISCLQNLGLSTIGAFLRLPQSGIRLRFGSNIDQLYQFAQGSTALPLQTVPTEQELILETFFQHEVTDAMQLLPYVEELLKRLLQDVHKKGDLIREIFLTLHTEDQQVFERIRPAEPTTQQSFLLQLIRLRLENSQSVCGQRILGKPDRGQRILGTRILGMRLTAQRVAASSIQLDLFQTRSNRNLKAGAKAFALIRAEIGNNAIQIAQIADEHLPERQFVWRNSAKPVHPRLKPSLPERQKLIRRVLLEPKALSCSPEHSIIHNGRAKHRGGPYIISGQWWEQHVDREYHFVETEPGRILWIYYDKLRERWIVQGCLT